MVRVFDLDSSTSIGLPDAHCMFPMFFVWKYYLITCTKVLAANDMLFEMVVLAHTRNVVPQALEKVCNYSRSFMFFPHAIFIHLL